MALNIGVRILPLNLARIEGKFPAEHPGTAMLLFLYAVSAALSPSKLCSSAVFHPRGTAGEKKVTGQERNTLTPAHPLRNT